MEDSEGDRSLSLSSLICLEDESCFDDEEGSQKELSFSLNVPVPMENDDEYVKMLVSKEMNLEIKDNRCEEDCPNDSWLKCSRFSAVQWMLKVEEHVWEARFPILELAETRQNWKGKKHEKTRKEKREKRKEETGAYCLPVEGQGSSAPPLSFIL
ncbi:hypothetical protein AAC387_Pa02g4671 [Persea americana]